LRLISHFLLGTAIRFCASIPFSRPVQQPCIHRLGCKPHSLTGNKVTDNFRVARYTVT